MLPDSSPFSSSPTSRLIPLPPFRLACAGEESQKNREQERRYRTMEGPLLFGIGEKLPKSSSCAGLRSPSKLLKRSSAAVRAELDVVSEKQRVHRDEGSRTKPGVPKAASNEFTVRAEWSLHCDTLWFVISDSATNVTTHLTVGS